MVLLLDSTGLNNPGGHAVHWGCLEVAPATFSVYVPAAHFVCSAQESVMVLLLDMASL